MKTIEELKKEQYDLKAKLHEVIEFTNSKEFFELSSRERNLVGQQRAGIEMYLNALTNRIFNKDDSVFDSSSLLWPMMLGGIYSGSSGLNNPDYWKDQLRESDFEAKEGEDE